MRNWKIWMIVLVGLLVGCSSPPEAAPTEFSRRAMLENIVNNVILPLHADFVAQTAVLETAAATFSNDPTAANLQTLQDEWRKADNLWQEAHLYEFDRMMVLHNQIVKYPVDAEFIDDILARELTGLDNDFIESVGSPAKGLSAIEYLIFAEDSRSDTALTRLTNSQSRMEYLVAATQNLHNKAQEAEAYWLPGGNDYANTFVNADGGGETFNSSLSMLNNQMVAVLEIAIREKLGRPLGIAAGDGPHPELVRAGLSGSSLAQIQHDLTTVENAFTGGDGLGLDDYLDYLGAESEGVPLSQKINEQFAATHAALQAIELPLATAVTNDTATVQAAYDELRKLLILIKVDMANQLGVTITFNDSDGD
jgi:predicted lipoprotein